MREVSNQNGTDLNEYTTAHTTNPSITSTQTIIIPVKRTKSKPSFNLKPISSLIKQTQRNFIERLELIERMEEALYSSLNSQTEILFQVEHIFDKLRTSIRSIASKVVKSIIDYFYIINTFIYEKRKTNQTKSGIDHF